MGKAQENVIGKCRAHNLLVVPRRIADIEILERCLLGKFRAQVGDNLIIRIAHLRWIEVVEPKHRRRGAEWSSPNPKSP